MGSDYESSDGERQERVEEKELAVLDDQEFEQYVDKTSEQIRDEYGDEYGEYGDESIGEGLADNEKADISEEADGRKSPTHEREPKNALEYNKPNDGAKSPTKKIRDKALNSDVQRSSDGFNKTLAGGASTINSKKPRKNSHKADLESQFGRSRRSNYSGLTNKPLPFNAVRFIAM